MYVTLTRFAVTLTVTLGFLTGCPTPTPPPDPPRAIACEEEEDCADLGPGHMCMGGGCMVMIIDAPAVEVPASSDSALDPQPLDDLDPDPAVFEANLVALVDTVELVPGTATEAFVYKQDGAAPARIPGPLIDVEAGTRVLIHFTNLLDEPTTIHWHGLVLPNEMDGAPDDVAGIAAGASFDFDFVAAEPSLYWFHPHIRGDVQIERGLYGAFRVREASPPAVDSERIFVLDDVLLDDARQVEPRAEGPAMTPDGQFMTFEGMMGRQGNRLLLNGKSNPFVDVVAGTVERWRIVNVANSRFFRLAIPGHSFVIIGTDVGFASAPDERDELLLAPGERYDVLVRMDGDPSSEVALVTKHHNRGHDMADPGDLVVATLRYDAAPAPVPTPLPVVTRDIERLVASAEPDQIVRMDEDLLRGARVGFSLNDELWPDVTPLSAALGDEETWDIVNETHMDHPFHLHGFPFQVVERAPLEGGDTVAEPMLAWKDTVIVGPRQRLRFVVRYDGFPGMWMLHCHILEHAERGMMTMIDVAD